MSRFFECLMPTLREEGGSVQHVGRPLVRIMKLAYMNHPADPGGSTFMGVTQGVYDAWLRARGRASIDVRAISDAEIFDIYRENYWDQVRGDELPSGLDLAVFDFAVNSGPHRAICRLQMVLGMKVDGILGVRTMQAIRECNPGVIVPAYIETRRAFCRKLKNYWAFKGGWEVRWNRIERAAMEMLGAEVGPEAITAQVATNARAIEPVSTSMLTSDTGNTALVTGTSSGAGMGLAVGQAVKAALSAGVLTLGTVLVELMSSLTFWTSFVALVGSLIIWFERRRKLKLETAT